MEGFQTQVNTQPAPGVAGDFASSNPRFNVLAGPGGLVSGAAGVTIGRFAWVNYAAIDGDNAPALVNNFGIGAPTGIVHREQQALITTFLGNSTMLIPPGFQMALMNGGDFFMKNDGTTQALVGQTVYADLDTGRVSFATKTASVTGSIAASTASITAGIQGNILTVSAVGSGSVVPGMTLSGTSGTGNVATGTKVVTQLSGTIGGVGTYAVDIPEQTVAAGVTITSTYGTLTVSAVGSGTIAVGDLVTGTGVSATATHITALGTGVGLTGTYIVDVTQTMSSSALTIGNNVATKFVAASSGLAGELVKITDHLNG